MIVRVAVHKLQTITKSPIMHYNNINFIVSQSNEIRLVIFRENIMNAGRKLNKVINFFICFLNIIKKK